MKIVIVIIICILVITMIIIIASIGVRTTRDVGIYQEVKTAGLYRKLDARS